MKVPPFRITPKNKKLLKSCKVRQWLKGVEEAVKKDMEDRGVAWWK